LTNNNDDHEAEAHEQFQSKLIDLIDTSLSEVCPYLAILNTEKPHD